MSRLNVTAALRSLGGNSKLYLKVIVKFISGYENSAETVSKHIAAGEMEEAERLAHTVKGLAATIGAEDLSKQWAIIETGCREGKSYDELAPNLADLAQELSSTIAHCRNVDSELGL